MKRAIEWFDELSDDFSCKPSEIVDMVEGVRREALDSVELVVQRMLHAEGTLSGKATAKTMLEHVLEEIKELRSVK